MSPSTRSSIFSLLVLALVGLPTLTLHAQEDPCDATVLLRQAKRQMQTGARTIDVRPLLERAAFECPDDSVSYEVFLYSALSLMMDAQVPDARAAAQQALAFARSDDEEVRASRLLQLIQELLAEVVIQSPDGRNEQRSAVQLEGVSLETLPSSEVLVDIAGSRLQRYVARGFLNMVDSAVLVSREGMTAPLILWLPKGKYTLSNGQTFESVPERTVVTLVGDEIRWSQHTFQASPAMMVTAPDALNVVGSEGVINPRVLVGTQLRYAFLPKTGPLRRNNILLSAQLDLMGWGIASDSGRYGYDPDVCVDFGDQTLLEGASRDVLPREQTRMCGLGLGVGMGRPLSFGGRLVLLPTVGLSYTRLNGLFQLVGDAVASVPEASTDPNPQHAQGSSASYANLIAAQLGIQANVKLMDLKERGQLDATAGVGLSTGLSWVREVDDCQFYGECDQATESQRTEVEAPEVAPPVLRPSLGLTGGAQAGLTYRF